MRMNSKKESKETKKLTIFEIIIHTITAITAIVSLSLIWFTYSSLNVMKEQNELTRGTLEEMKKQSSLTDSSLRQMTIQSEAMQKQSQITDLTLKEMQLQRIKAYEPDLVINTTIPFGIYADFGSSADGLIDLETYSFNDIADTNHIGKVKSGLGFWTKDYDVSNDCQIPLTNIGLGNAINVRLRWNFDTLRIIHYYNDSLRENVPGIKNIAVDRKYGININNQHVNSLSDITYFKYVYSTAKNNFQIIKIPEVYLKLWVLGEYSKFIYIESKIRNCPTCWRDLSPPLYLRVTYSDVNGKDYEKNFKFSIDRAPYTMASGEYFYFENASLTVREVPSEKKKKK